MAKFSGLVGYVTTEKTAPGVWTPVETPKKMRGDVLRQSSSNQNDDKVNSDISFNHRISLVGDAYGFGNYFNIKWVEVDGYKWEATSVEVQRPRIIVTLGGPYNA